MSKWATYKEASLILGESEETIRDRVSQGSMPVREDGAVCVNVLDRKLETFEFSLRTAKCLLSGGITTLGDLVGKSPKELLSLTHFGRKSFLDVIGIVTALGLELRDDTITAEDRILVLSAKDRLCHAISEARSLYQGCIRIREKGERMISTFHLVEEQKENAAEQWNLVGGLPSECNIISFVNIANTLYARTGNGIFRIEKGEWVKTGLPVHFDSLVKSGDTLYVANHAAGVYRWSEKEGTYVYIGLREEYVSNLVVMNHSLYAGTAKGIFRWKKIGNTWHQLPAVVRGDEFCWIHAMAVCGDTLFVGTNDGLYVYKENWPRWERIVSSPDASHLLVAGNKLFGTTYDKVFLVELDQDDCCIQYYNLPPLKSCHVGSHGTDLFISTYYQYGVLCLRDGEDEPIEMGLKGQPIVDLIVFQDYIYAATYLGRVLRTSVYGQWNPR